MQRAEIVVRGKVQKVGYRSLVEEIANKFGLVGKAVNREDGTVLVICEGEKEQMNKFIDEIRIKDSVIEAEIKNGDVKFKKPTGEYNNFEAKFEGLEDLRESAEAGVKYIRKLLQSTNSMKKDMNTNFENMDKKYGQISKNMENIAEELKQQRQLLLTELNSFRSSVDSIGNKIEKGIARGIGEFLKDK